MIVANRENAPVPLHHHLAAVATLLVYCCALNWQFFAGRMPYLDDAGKETIAQMQQYAEGLREGRIPLWNNDLGCGYYQHASGQSAMYYPPNLLLYRFLHPSSAYRTSLVLHSFAACVWLYLFGLALGLGVLPALLTAVCVGAGGTMAAHQVHINIVLGLSHAFCMLWLVTQWSRRDRHWVWAAAGAANLGLSLLGGQPQYVWLGALMSLTYLGAMAAGRSGSLCRWAPLAGRAGIVLIAGVLLAGIQLAPLISYLQEFPRPMPAGRYDFITAGSFGWDDFARFVLPGAGLRDELGLQYWETQGFVGTAALVLGLATLLSRGSWPARKRYAVALLVVGTLLMLGHNTPLYLVLAHVPPFSLFRIPGRAVILVSLGIGLLASESLEQPSGDDTRRRWRRASAAGVAVVGLLSVSAALSIGAHRWSGTELGLAGLALLLVAGGLWMAPGRRNWVACAAIVGTALQLGVLWSILNPTVPAAFWTSPPHAAEICMKTARHGGERVVCLQPTGALHPAPPTEPGGDWRNRLVANTSAIWGVPSAQVGDAIIPASALFADAQAINKAHDAGDLAAFCDIIGIRWVTMPPEPLGEPWTRPDPALPELYENPGSVGPYYLCSRVIQDAQGYLRPGPPGGPYDLTPVNCTDLGPGRLLLEYDSPIDSNLFFMQGRRAGWLARIDGVSVPLQAAAPGYFMWLPAPAGQHRVELSFQPLDYDVGLAMTLVGIGLMVTLLFLAFGRNRVRATPATAPRRAESEAK